MHTSKNGHDLYKLQTFGMLNLPSKTPKGSQNISKRHKKKPKSLTQIMINYPFKKGKKTNASNGVRKKEIGIKSEISKKMLSKLQSQLFSGKSRVNGKGNVSQKNGLGMFKSKLKSTISSNKLKSKHFLKVKHPKKNSSRNEIGKRQRIAQMVTDASYFDSLLHNKELSNLSSNFLSKKSNKLSKRY